MSRSVAKNDCFKSVLIIYKSTIRPHLEYCGQISCGNPDMYLEIHHKFNEKEIHIVIGPKLAFQFRSLCRHRN